MDPIRTVCFTGPRPNKLHGYAESNRGLYREISAHVSDLVRDAYRLGFRTFISGGAQGFDQLAFWGVEHAKQDGLDVQNILYLPFEGQELQWSETGIFGQQEYRNMLGHADGVYYCSEPPGDEKWAVVQALHQRNHAMVNSSSLVIALVLEENKDFSHSTGGTAECLRYATKAKRSIFAMQYGWTDGEDFAGDFL